MYFVIEMLTKEAKNPISGAPLRCWVTEEGSSVNPPKWTYDIKQSMWFTREEAERCLQLIRDHYPQWKHASCIHAG